MAWRGGYSDGENKIHSIHVIEKNQKRAWVNIVDTFLNIGIEWSIYDEDSIPCVILTD